ncbi:MAG: hypothetical protein ABS46_15775 [Cytophagaceae bacterium SCN 52-12]|nr:MAG: hypothetical protein ABS46_15775 [Cytophagaceae bacterium SCN 52-12]
MKQFFLRRGKLCIYIFYFLLFFLLLWAWAPAKATEHNLFRSRLHPPAIPGWGEGQQPAPEVAAYV